MADLRDLKIIDLTRILSGPYCTMYFADMGADVIKVEPPQGDDTRTWGPPFLGAESSYFLSVNRNKRSIVLDLKTEFGKNALRTMVKEADIVVENFRPGTMERLGFGFDVLKEINAKIILASISGFGQTGRYRSEPGYDVIAQGMGGLMSVTGNMGGPPVKPGFSLADVGAGMWAIIGILTALYNRDRGEQAQWVDVSLLEAMMGFQTYAAGNYFASGQDPVPMGNAHPNICPYQAFAAADGYFNLAVGNDGLWKTLCQGIEKEEWIEDKRFRTNKDRVRNRDVLIPLLEAMFVAKPVREWVELFRPLGIPCGDIYKLSDLYSDPYVLERNMLFAVNHPTAGSVQQVGVPVKFLNDTTSRHGAEAPPLLGQHTAEILSEFGVSPEGEAGW